MLLFLGSFEINLMDSKNNNPTTDLLNILSKAMDAKVYGSVEVYLEDGQITQISQRIIKKIKKATAASSHQIRVKKTKSNAKNSDARISIEL